MGGYTLPGGIDEAAINVLIDAAIAALNLDGNTYLPVATNLSNMDSVTPVLAHYFRKGNEVFVEGLVNYDPTAAGASAFRLSLPVASPNLTSADLSGGMMFPDRSIVNFDGSITGQTGGTAGFSFTNTAGTATALRYWYAYTIK